MTYQAPVKRFCDNCCNGKSNFNLFWCMMHKKSVSGTETCADWGFPAKDLNKDKKIEIYDEDGMDSFLKTMGYP